MIKIWLKQRLKVQILSITVKLIMKKRGISIANITSPTLLILDDFCIERSTEYALEQIYNIINARYLKSKPTIITTNLNFKDIETEQEDIMLGRIYSRIIEMCLPLRVIGVDRRKIQSKEKMKKAQNLIDEQ